MAASPASQAARTAASRSHYRTLLGWAGNSPAARRGTGRRRLCPQAPAVATSLSLLLLVVLLLVVLFLLLLLLLMLTCCC